jgi:hypothetical protein
MSMARVAFVLVPNPKLGRELDNCDKSARTMSREIQEVLHTA